ncbi:asparagine synthase [Streptacidiphilus sp. NEAU-YB345]|uniref:Asparagine synthase n=2 Tax=Streptacidiphilus fuscans TaxID=2789292 RepID=A0A931B1A6_9ACTN|nr:asparagine synthase [Streptacidiphilus fuscans]
MFVGRPHHRGAQAPSGGDLPDETLIESGIGYDGPDEAGEQVVRRRDVSVDLSGGSASTVLALLAATIPRAAKVPAARPAAHFDASASASAGVNPGVTPEPEPGSARTTQPTRRTERAAANGTAANGGVPPVRHPALGTFSEERWGDPRSYRTLHHGPPPTSPAAEAESARRTGAVRGSWARRVTVPEPEPTGLLAITWTDAEGATGSPLSPAREAELLRARSVAEAAADRLDHVVVPGGEDALPYADLGDDPLAGPLTDEPGPALVAALRHRARLAAAGTDHISGHGARQVLDGHPARLADLLLERRRSPLLRPVAALARADSAMVGTPVAVVRAARRLARTAYTDGLLDAAAALVAGRTTGAPPGTAGEASTRALAWCTPGPAAAWLTADARSAVAQRLHLAARAGAPDERPGARRARLALQRRAAEFRVLAQVVESAPDARGQRLHAPFLDNQVVRACRQVPDRARIQPGARHGILRAVLAGAGVQEVPDGWGNGLPPDPYAAADSVRAGLRRSADALDRLFAASLLGDWGLIDAEGVRAALRAAASDAPVPLDGLADVVAMELWLRRLRARRGSCWTGLPPLPRPAVTSGVPNSSSSSNVSNAATAFSSSGAVPTGRPTPAVPPTGRSATVSASHVS